METKIYKAWEVLLELYDVERCPECQWHIGDDTEYKDFSSKSIIVCAQCGYEWYLDELDQLIPSYRSGLREGIFNSLPQGSK